jgi:hypothetical protein
MRFTQRLLFLLGFLFVFSCTDDAVFVVDVAADNGLAGQDGNIQRIRATLTNGAEQDVLLFPEEEPTTISLPTAFSFSLPKELSGDVEVLVEALDANSLIIGTGIGAAPISLGERTRFLINLTPP